MLLLLQPKGLRIIYVIIPSIIFFFFFCLNPEFLIFFFFYKINLCSPLLIFISNKNFFRFFIFLPYFFCCRFSWLPIWLLDCFLLLASMDHYYGLFVCLFVFFFFGFLTICLLLFLNATISTTITIILLLLLLLLLLSVGFVIDISNTLT